MTTGLTAALGVSITNDLRLNLIQAVAKSVWTENGVGGAHIPDLQSLLPRLFTGQNVVSGFSIGWLGQFFSGGGGSTPPGPGLFPHPPPPHPRPPTTAPRAPTTHTTTP